MTYTYTKLHSINDNGTIRERGWKNADYRWLHGEYILNDCYGNPVTHAVYNEGDATSIDPTDLTPEDKVFLSLKHNIKFLS